MGPTEAPDQPTPRRHYTGKCVLVVEDDAINRAIAARLLTRVGLAVEMAEDGREAIARAALHAYDLILMDVHMPVMDGIDATRAIRARHGLHQPPILALTASTFEAERGACLAAGMDDFVLKPVDPEALYLKLARWLGGAAP